MLDLAAPLQRSPADVRQAVPDPAVASAIANTSAPSAGGTATPPARLTQHALVAKASVVPDSLRAPRVLKPFGIVMWAATTPSEPRIPEPASENRLT